MSASVSNMLSAFRIVPCSVLFKSLFQYLRIVLMFLFGPQFTSYCPWTIESLEKPSQGSSSCGLSAPLFAGGLLRGDLPLSLVARCCSDLRTVLTCSCCEVDTVCFEATSFLLFLVAGGVFSFTGWGVLLGAGCCSSSESEESEEEK